MRSYKRKSVLLTVSVITLIALSILAVILVKGNKSKGATTAFSATVKNVVVTETETRVYPKIYINESETCLLIISFVGKQIDLEIVRNLQPGQKIYFRVENYKAGQFDEAKMVDVISLRTDTQVIYSLDDYNRYFDKLVYPRRIAGRILITLNIAVVVLTYLSMKKQKDNDPRF